MISTRGFALFTGVAASASALLLAAACSSSSAAGERVASGPDASDDVGSTSEEGGGPTGESGTDAKTDATSSTCTGACTTTKLVADFGGKMRTLVRAQFGTQALDAGAGFHTEAHLGGAPACPTMNSPTTDYTLVVSAVPRTAAGGKATDRDGVKGTFFDFKGDLGIPPLTKAITVYVSNLSVDSATPPAWIAYDVSAAFREGNVAGHVYAEYCTSLSD